jgi:threonine aldolase
MFSGIDLSSDTATKPTAAMKQAMCAAPLGDEQKNEDPTTLALEQMAADMFGFSSALFLPTATMANQIAIKTLCEPGEELLAASNCHLFNAETGGPAIHSQVICKPIPTVTGIFSATDIKQHVQTMKRVLTPVSRLISVENTTNFGGGIAWSKDQLDEVVDCAKKLGLKLHMDGARVFNAHIKNELPLHEIVTGFDTVTVCLSKGLGCPMGALLLFDKKYRPKIIRLKHLMGGALRQSGMIAAAGIYALQHHVKRLQEDHDNAYLFATLLLKSVPQLKLLNYPPPTNMVYFSWQGQQFSPIEFSDYATRQGVRFSQVAENIFRAVTHLDVSRDDMLKAVEVLHFSFDPANQAIVE